MTRTGIHLPVVRQTLGMDLDPKKQVSPVSKEPRTLRSCMILSTANVALAGREHREAIETWAHPLHPEGCLIVPHLMARFCPALSVLLLEKGKWAWRESGSHIAHRSHVTLPREKGPNVSSLQTRH